MGYKETQSANLISGGDQELDGDKIDIDLTLVNITADTAPAEVDSAAQLSAIIKGIDNALDDFAAVDHDATHIQGGTDEIDGDKLDIDFTPSNYTPSTSPAEVDDLDQLSAHLSGIDTALASAGSNDNSMNVTVVATGTTANISPTFNSDNDIEVAVLQITGATDGTVTLPAIAAGDIGSVVRVKLEGAAGSNKVTVTADGADTIDNGSSSEEMSNDNEAVDYVVTSATNWSRF